MNSSNTCLEQLAGRRMVVVTGKGGVGKSALAAALALQFSQQGRRVLLLEVDPRENAHQMLGLPPSGGEITSAGERLWLQNLKPREALDRIIRERVKLGVLAKRVLGSPIYHQLSEGMPGLRQLALLDHARRWSSNDAKDAQGAGPRGDVVVLDAPATGHGISLLEAPRLISEVIQDGPVGEMAAELAALVLHPGACGVVVVTLAEEMPVQETVELAQALRERVGLAPELLVINGLYPPHPDRPSKTEGSLARLWRKRREINERELTRLDRAWDGPRVELPLLPLERGPELAARLAALLAGGLGDGLADGLSDGLAEGTARGSSR